MRSRHAVALALALLVVAPSAHAQGKRPPADAPGASPAQLEEARAHFNRGVKFYKDADYRSALVEFQEAYRVAPNARVLFNIGQTYEELQDFAGAVKALRDYLKEGGATISKARRAEVDKDLRRLESHVAVEIWVSEPGADVVVDGNRRQELGKSPLSAALLLNGGKWTVSATKPGFERAEERLTAAGGDTKKVTLTLAPTIVVAERPVTPAPVTTPTPSTPVPRTTTRNLTPFWVGLAVTGGLAAGAGVTGVLTLGAKKDFDREVARLPGDSDAISSARSHEKTLALVTDVLGGAAVVSAVITVVLYLGAGQSSPSSAASITPYVSPTGVGASGTF